MEYKSLAKEFVKGGFTWTQLWREGNFAIYKQTPKRWVEPNGYFIPIKIETHDGWKIGGVDIPPAEVFPNGESWGSKAFTCFSLEEAQRKIEYMKNHADEIILKDKDVDPETGNVVVKSSLKLPEGEFSIKSLGELNKNIKTHNLYPAVKKLIESKKIKETRRQSNQRGKATIFFIKI